MLFSGYFLGVRIHWPVWHKCFRTFLQFLDPTVLRKPGVLLDIFCNGKYVEIDRVQRGAEQSTLNAAHEADIMHSDLHSTIFPELT